MDASLPLAGKTIVITRPMRQSKAVGDRLTRMGANVIAFALIAIEPPTDKPLLLTKLNNLKRYDYLIFTSRNAVEMTFATLTQPPQSQAFTLANTTQVAAVGKQTAQALEKQGVLVSIVPTAMFNSEALLEHAALQNVEAKRIAIVRGEGGRDLLQSTLQQRGGLVEYIDVYRRVCPVTNLLPLVKCQAQRGIDIIVLTSVEGISTLFKLGAGQDWLTRATLLVGSQRMAAFVSATGHQGKVIVADDPSDDQVIRSLINWAEH